MSGENKAVKAALKETKDFITRKDYKSALRCCKKALNIDKKNYMAFVFCGLCLTEMQQPDQALQAYKKAVEIDPTQLTGWQGLASFYEKQLAAINETDIENRTKVATQLSQTYEKMLELTKDAEKFENLSEKLVEIYLKSVKDMNRIVSIFMSRISFMEGLGDSDRIRRAHSELIRILNTQQIAELTCDQEQVLRDSLQKVINDSSSIQNLEHLKISIKLLYKVRHMEHLCNCAIRMNRIFPENIYALEWICKIYLEWVTGALDFSSSELEQGADQFIQKLLGLSPSSNLAQLANGAFVWCSLKNPLEASKIILPIIERNPNPNFFGVFVLCQSLFDIKEFASCERWLTLASTLLDKVKEDQTRALMKNRLDTMAVNTFYSQAKFENAAKIFENCFGTNSDNDSKETKILRAKISARMGREDQVEDVLRKFEIGNSDKIVRAILLKAKGMNERALEKVESFLKSGDRFYGGSNIRRTSVRESTDRAFFEQPLGPLSSKASFNPKATVLPRIGTNMVAKSVEEIATEKRSASRRTFGRKFSDRHSEVKSPLLHNDRIATPEPSPLMDTTAAAAADYAMKKSLNPFAATFFLKRFIRNRRGNIDNDKDVETDANANAQLSSYKREDPGLRYSSRPSDISIKILDDGKMEEDKVFVKVTMVDVDASKAEGRDKWKKLLRRTASYNSLAFKSVSEIKASVSSPKSAVMSTYDPNVKFERAERKHLTPTAFSPFNSGLALREKVLQRKKEQTTSWAFLRARLANAKVTDAFTSLRFYVNNNRLTVLRTLGQGGYAKVYEVFNEDNELFALKVVDLAESKVKEELLKEINFLKMLKDCDRVIQIYDYEHKEDLETGDNKLYVLLERGECDLEHIVHKLRENERFTPAKIRYYWEEMLEALKTVHDAGIVHADIKPSNFLLVGGQLKLIDFGLAIEMPPNETQVKRNFVGGTKDFLSPETLSCYVVEEGSLRGRCPSKDIQAVIGYKSDIWAMGIVLHQWMYDGVSPYAHVAGGRPAKIAAITNPDYPVELEPLPDPHVMDTLRLCLEKDPLKRASTEQLLKHSFLQPTYPDVVTGQTKITSLRGVVRLDNVSLEKN